MKNKLILIHGPSGAGKSTLSNLIKTKIKPSVHLSVDSLKFTITDFRKDHEKAIKIVKEILPVLVNEYLKKNMNVVLEYQVSESEIKKYKKIYKNKDVEIYVFELNGTLNCLKERIIQRQKEAGKNPPSIQKIKKDNEIYNAHKVKDSIYFDTEKYTPKQIAGKIIKIIKSK